jgi:two-component system, sensor histidine kinase and response regulator
MEQSGTDGGLDLTNPDSLLSQFSALRKRITDLEQIKAELELRLTSLDHEKRRLEEELREQIAGNFRFRLNVESELMRYQSIVANIPGAVYRATGDQDSKIEFISDQVEEITGYPASDFINSAVRTMPSLMSQEDIFRAYDHATECLRQMKPFETEYRITHRDGSTRWISHRARGVYSPEGNLIWIDGVIFDVTDKMNFFGIAEAQ